MALSGIQLSAGVLVGVNKSLDAKYGPFSDIATAKSDVGLTLRYLGLTVGIITGGTVEEYWWENGTDDADLVPKGGGSGGGEWGTITGTLSNQTDLQDALNNKQTSGNYITDLTGEATAIGPGVATVTLSTPAVTSKLLSGVNITGGTVVDTDTILEGFGKLQNQINGLIGGTLYQGVWDANTNTPTLTSGVGTDGYYYIVDVYGTTNLDGISEWHVGDWAIFHDSTWQKVDNTDAVVTVNGYTGAVSLVSSDIPEGLTNLYYTNTRARQALSLTTTGTSGAATYDNNTGEFNIPQYQSTVSFNTIGAAPNSSGASISGGAITLQPANISFGGVVTTGTQTFSGAKTFVTSGNTFAGQTTFTSAGQVLISSGSNRHLILNNPTQSNWVISNANGVAYSTAGALTFFRDEAQYLNILPDGTVNYAVDRSSLYTDRSLVDKAYVDAKESSLSFTSPLTRTVDTITINEASSLQDGYLSSTNWNTFNNKQNELDGSGFVKVTGTIVSYDNNTYLTDNQPITLTGAVTGSGSTSIITTLADSIVGINNLSATGIADSTSYLRGDNTWQTIVSGGMAIGDNITSATEGSVLFAGAGGVLQQDNSNFFWDDTNNRLGIGTTTPPTFLSLYTSNSNAAKTEMLRMEVKNAANSLLDYFKFNLGATNSRGGSIVFGEIGGGFPEAGLQFNLNHTIVYQGGINPLYLQTNGVNRVTVSGSGPVTVASTLQATNMGIGAAPNSASYLNVIANTTAVGQLYLPPSAVDYTGTLPGMIWNNAGEVKFIDTGSIVNRFQKVYNNTLFKGVGTRVAVYNALGDQSATDLLIEQFVTDTDVITAITGATYVNNRATITPANSKVFNQGQMYDDGTYTYLAIDDNLVRRW